MFKKQQQHQNKTKQEYEQKSGDQSTSSEEIRTRVELNNRLNKEDQRSK
jgi:hypothetical protein